MLRSDLHGLSFPTLVRLRQAARDEHASLPVARETYLARAMLMRRVDAINDELAIRDCLEVPDDLSLDRWLAELQERAAAARKLYG